MRPHRRPLVAVLLVLLHVLAPGLHLLQHAASAMAHPEAGQGACSHACCHAPAVDERAREPRQTDLPAAERAGHEHDHDCDLCTQLHRLHGYVAPAVLVWAKETRAVRTRSELTPLESPRERVALPPARAPPQNEA